MPERFLLQILRDLSKQGILHSTRGGGGGFALGRPAEEISLLDVIEAVDGPVQGGLPARCALPVETGGRLQHMLSDIAEEVRRQLAAIKISGLLPAPETAGHAGNASTAFALEGLDSLAILPTFEGSSL